LGLALVIESVEELDRSVGQGVAAPSDFFTLNEMVIGNFRPGMTVRKKVIAL
jgi:hypothetical protein